MLLADHEVVGGLLLIELEGLEFLVLEELVGSERGGEQFQFLVQVGQFRSDPLDLLLQPGISFSALFELFSTLSGLHTLLDKLSLQLVH